ncbi:MAG TPA: class I SAM-dependent methyltransferase [Magnetospirillaceae bacterium]|jgi:caffeoyl-CoA O-methyltransferase
MTETLYDYLLDTSLREHPVQKKLREATVGIPGAGMQISPDQGQFMALVARIIGARRAIEVGTFTGYSALAVALAMPEDGRIVCCDINAETTSIARRFWTEAGVADKIDLRIAPALKTLDALLAEDGPGNGAGTYDMMFIDADKTGYDSYYERGLQLLRAGGVMLIDNVLWGGSVADPKDHEASTEAIRALNLKVRDDKRVDMCLLTVGDGLSMVRKR